MEKELGKVDSVRLGLEGHGLLTFMIGLDFGGTHQGFGNYMLDTYNQKLDCREGMASGTDMILRLITLFGVNDWNEIKGKQVFALREKKGFTELIVGLEMPAFEGGRKLIIKDWQERWFPGEGK